MRRAWLYGQELQLTPKEFDLLSYLMRNRGVVVRRDQLLRDVWGDRVSARSQTLDVHIRWLRQKVELNPTRPVYIQTVRMIGYRFVDPSASEQQWPATIRPLNLWRSAAWAIWPSERAFGESLSST